MSTAKKWIAAPIDDVWALLADARSYAFWVVGSHNIRAVEGDWPAVGSTFHHVQGHGILKLADTTTVVEVDPPHRILLEVRIRPFLVGPVELTLEPDGEGTCVAITERAEGGLGGLLPGFLTGPPIAVRNAAALRRLAGMAWARSAALGRAPDDAGRVGSAGEPALRAARSGAGR